MHKLMYLGLLGVLLTLFACGGNDEPASQTVTTTADAPPVGLTVMTWRYLPQDRAIIEKFEARYRIQVEVIVRPMREVVAAAQQGHVPRADVLLLPTIEDAARLRGFNVLQPFFVDAFTEGQVGDRDLDNEGYYAGLSKWTMSAVYNPKAVTEAEASSYLGIAKAMGRGARVGVAHPDSSGLASLVGGLAANLSPDAAALWTRTVYGRATNGLYGSDYDQMNRMLAGEIDMALVSSGAAARWLLNGDKLHYDAGALWRIALPATEASNVNFPNWTCVAMPANTQRRNLAMAFINTLFSPENQQVLTDAWFEFPTYAFGTPNEYLNNYRGVVGNKFTAEMAEAACPVGWAMINQVAEESRGQ